MDLLYVIGKGSKRGNLELRMSLRSICKYAKNIGKVVVAGAPPEWLSDEVIKLEVADKYQYKHSNILLCIEEAVTQGLLDGEFLYSSDDHFYVKPVDFDNYPYFFKCNLRSQAYRIDPHYKYHKSLVDTRELCIKYGLTTYNFSQHCNTHMHSDIIKGIIEIIHESYSLPYGVEPTSLIMNAWQMIGNPPPCTKRKDLKILEVGQVNEIYNLIGERDCFSIGDTVFRTPAMTEFFTNEYGERCRLEKE